MAPKEDLIARLDSKPIDEKTIASKLEAKLILDEIKFKIDQLSEMNNSGKFEQLPDKEKAEIETALAALKNNKISLIDNEKQIEPKVCLCGQARSGTSMMMRVLDFGGLVIDTEDNYSEAIQETRNAIYRNPYGIYENRESILKKEFINSFKLVDSTRFIDVPSDYKFIFINRPFEQILKSWMDVCARMEAQGREIEKWKENVLARVNKNREQWRLILEKKQMLLLEYNEVVADPDKMASAIAAYIDTDNFSFNVKNAIKAIDKNLYINRA
jgi:hypothetical protein